MGDINGVPAHTDLYDQAEQVLREAIATMPDQSQFYYSLGVVLGKVQRYKVHQPHWFTGTSVLTRWNDLKLASFPGLIFLNREEG